jgi:hypothetical protein
VLERLVSDPPEQFSPPVMSQFVAEVFREGLRSFKWVEEKEQRLYPAKQRQRDPGWDTN